MVRKEYTAHGTRDNTLTDWLVNCLVLVPTQAPTSSLYCSYAATFVLRWPKKEKKKSQSLGEILDVLAWATLCSLKRIEWIWRVMGLSDTMQQRHRCTLAPVISNGLHGTTVVLPLGREKRVRSAACPASLRAKFNLVYTHVANRNKSASRARSWVRQRGRESDLVCVPIP